MKFGLKEIEQAGVQDAVNSWDSGSQAYVWSAGGQARKDIGAIYTETLDAILAIGWRLHSTAAGPGFLFFVFIRES